MKLFKSWYWNIFFGLLAILSFILSYSKIQFPNNVKSIAKIVLGVLVVYLLIVVFIKTKNFFMIPIEKKWYNYQARRYGWGYKNFKLECIIQEDGSATIIRNTEVETFSELSKIDTFVNIAEEDPSGQPRYIEAERAVSDNENFDVSLDIKERKPGRIQAEIFIAPALKDGDNLSFRVYEKLPKELFAINQTKEEIEERDTKTDYYGWHIIRPTKNFQLSISFPPGNGPIKYRKKIQYASSAGTMSELTRYEEQKKVDKPHKESVSDRDVITLNVDYPLFGLVYLIEWSPIPLERN